MLYPCTFLIYATHHTRARKIPVEVLKWEMISCTVFTFFSDTWCSEMSSGCKLYPSRVKYIWHICSAAAERPACTGVVSIIHHVAEYSDGGCLPVFLCGIKGEERWMRGEAEDAKEHGEVGGLGIRVPTTSTAPTHSVMKNLHTAWVHVSVFECLWRYICE